MNLNTRVIDALTSAGEAARLIEGKEVADYSWAELCSVSPKVGATVATIVGASWVASREQFDSSGFVPDFYQKEEESNTEFASRLARLQEARIVPVVKGSSAGVLVWDIAHPALDQYAGLHWIMAPAEVIDAIYKSDGASEVPALNDGEEMEDYIKRLAQDCFQRKAADMEITSFATAMRVRFHVLGEWGPWVGHLPIAAKSSFLRALCAMSSPPMDYEPGSDQNFKLEMRLHGVDTSWRVAITPAATGETVTIRLLPQVGRVPELSELGYFPAQVDLFNKVTQHRNGLVLITGETGSGKSTCLYSIIDGLNKRNKKVFSIEAPVELLMPGVVQLAENSNESVDERFRVTFSSGIRSSLRHHPDVLVVGETRDRETAFASASGSLTSHLTMTTLHTKDVNTSIKRYADLGVERALLADVMRMVVSQRLVRRLCQLCCVEQEDGTCRHRPGGCSHCGNTGFSGKVVVAEMCYFDDDAREAIVSNTLKSHFQRLKERGFYISFEDSAQRLIEAGIIDPVEVANVDSVAERALATDKILGVSTEARSSCSQSS